MLRGRYFIPLLIALQAGCGPAPPPPAQSPATVSSTASAIDQPEPTAAESPPAIEAQPALDAPQRGATPRDFAARLLRPDGEGGWLAPDEQAATELEKLGPATFETLQPLLADPEAAVRRGAAYHLLGLFDPNQPAQVEALSMLLDDDDRMVRGFGLSAAAQMQRHDQVAAVPRLAAMLDPEREPKPENRTKIVRLLSSLKQDANPAYEQAAESALSDPDSRVRAAALAALSQIDAPQRSLEVYSKALADADAPVRIVAAAKLRQLGPLAAPAAAALAGRLSDDDSGVRERATEALIAIGRPAVGPLAAALQSDDAEAKRQALAALALLGPHAAAARPVIERCQTDKDELVRKLAEAALKRIGEAP